MNELEQFLERIPLDYQALLAHRLNDPRWVALLQSIQRHENAARQLFPESIFPAYENVFLALHKTPVDQLKVILLGQDPYHTPGMAQGLAFSIPSHILPGSQEFPSSLRNINKALSIEGFRPLLHGNLSHWAEQGVLLFNACLTVQSGKPNSHLHFGWHQFTDALLHDLLQATSRIAVLLWGGFAHKKAAIFPAKDHLVLKSSHPSGLSVYKTNTPFLAQGDTHSCRHFTLVNDWLKQHHQPPIDW